MSPALIVTHCRMCEEKLEPPQKQPNDPRFLDRFSSRRKLSGQVALHPARISDLAVSLRPELQARQDSINARRALYHQMHPKEDANAEP